MGSKHFPIPCVEFCTVWHPSGTGDTPKPSHSDPRRCLFPPHLPQPMSVTTSLWDKPKPGSSLHFTTKAPGHSHCHSPEGEKEQAHAKVWDLHFMHAGKPHGKWVTPLPRDEGLYNRQREKKMFFSTSIQKRAARRFYSSHQHPIASQQFALTTKLSKKRQRPGHLSNGLRRSQLFAQETAKKPPKPAYHISPSYWSMTRRRIYGKRGQRGEKQKSIGSNRAWRKITSLIKRGYLPG